MEKISSSTSIEYLKGVGPKKLDLLKSQLSIFTISDLIEYYPFRYVDKSIFTAIKNINTFTSVPIKTKGKIISINTVGAHRKKRMSVVLSDESAKIELIWFKGIPWITKMLSIGKEYVVFGKPTIFNKKVSLAHPEIEPIEQHQRNPSNNIVPIYNSNEALSKAGLNSKGIQQIIKNVLVNNSFNFKETLPEYISKKYELTSKKEALYNIHLPTNFNVLKAAQEHLKFEELFYLQLRMLFKKQITQKKSTGFVFKKTDNYLKTFYKEQLPFQLTAAQKRVLKDIRSSVNSGKQMNRLLQGDVGSGKTIVAIITMLIALDNDFQSCIMAPTEILATQHYDSIKNTLNQLNIPTAILTGSTKAKDRKKLLESLNNGNLKIIIGTHALLEHSVKFKNLGLAIIDEQHRFGVKQRAKLWEKNTLPPHILLMTATPIPRTLAMTIYGDLDVSIIDELPPGRKPITTIHLNEGRQLQAFKYVNDAIKKKNQAYFVFPLIEESKTLDYKYLEDGFEYVSQRFPKPKYQICCVHGNMKPENKAIEIERFVKNQCQIMIATTVIEVGVNIPNATVMIIESAERFGLSQLHQLRGRVGRGADKSFCILVTGYKLSKEAKTRMQTMVETNDGFKIAEVDLKLRGPGDIQGLQQSGILDFKIANLATDNKILELSRNLALLILKKDILLKAPENAVLLSTINAIDKKHTDWGKIA